MHSRLPPEWAERARLEVAEDPALTPARLKELRDRLPGEPTAVRGRQARATRRAGGAAYLPGGLLQH